MKKRILVKSKGVDSVKMGNELAMMNFETGKYVVLNEVGKDVWNLIDGLKSSEDIIDEILSIYDVTEEVCREEVDLFFSQLLNEKLVESV